MLLLLLLDEAPRLLQSDGLEPYQGDTFVGILPMYHIYGTWAFLSYAPRHGATVALLPRFELGAFLKAIETYRVSLVHIAPPVAVLLAKDPRVDEYDVSSVRAIVSGAAPLGEDTAAQGGHYYEGDIDPWVGVTYTSDADGNAEIDISITEAFASAKRAKAAPSTAQRGAKP